ncbi:glycoside hydrolase family 25 protein [Shinella sp. BYT-45]|uniref:glycoside hydrolase family 25 protein n=1 Tax=Shinella sp. BYT-45 TaxID=3377377 RepID=UPI00397ED090
MNPKQLSGLAALLLSAALFLPAKAADVEPWKKPENAIVIDAYELNEIDWSQMLSDKRIAGFISKASDGLPESYSCKGDHGGDTVAHCKTMWRKYAVSRELYETRRLLARSKGLLWGAYHLARPGNPVDQANHFLDYANPQDDEMMVLDIEGIDPNKYMSLADAQVFAGHIRTRTGRYPVLYTNHVTARHIADNRDKYRILSRLPLWYARYRPGITGSFPMGNWENYALWQFSAAVNCSKRRCPYRVKGAHNDIDVNVAPMTKAELRKVWAFGSLLPEKPFEPVDEILTASIPAAGTLKAKAEASASAGAEAQTTGAVTLASGTLASFPVGVAAEAEAGLKAAGTVTVTPGRRVVEITPLNYQDF